MAPQVTPPTREEVRPPGLARWTVKHSLRSKDREEGLAAFEDEFGDDYAKSGDLSEARVKALRIGWDSLQRAYKPLIDISMYVLAILGVVLAVTAILMV